MRPERLAKNRKIERIKKQFPAHHQEMSARDKMSGTISSKTGVAMKKTRK